MPFFLFLYLNYYIILIEAQLIAKLKEGNQQAFMELIDLYKHLVFNTVLNMVMNFEEAEDITQEVFIQVFQSIQSFRGDSKLSTWLYRICLLYTSDAADE